MKSPTHLRDLAAAIWRNRREVVHSWFESQFSPQVLASFPGESAVSPDRDAVTTGYLLPLLRLLVEYARTGHQPFLDQYLFEWRRYAPHREGPEELHRYLSVVVPASERALLALFAGRDEESLREWLAGLHRPLLGGPAGNGAGMRLLMVGDCLMAGIQVFLPGRMAGLGIDLDVRYYYLSALMGANIDQDGIARAITTGKVDVIAASYLTYSGIPLYRALMEEADGRPDSETRGLVAAIAEYMASHVGQMRKLTDVPLLLHNASGLPLGRWRVRVPLLPPHTRSQQRALELVNAEISRLAQATENCFLIDEFALARRRGLRVASRPLFPQRVFRNAQFHVIEFERLLADDYAAIMETVARLRRTKLILVDFDNTLWDGVMADGPVVHHRDRQLLLKKLSEQGILLAAVSKNEGGNIRWDEMALSADDFVSLKINWNLKAQSAREIAEELNLGVDSFLLLDDNPAERELVRQELPTVVALDSADPVSWAAVGRLFSMPNTRETEEARTRKQLYQQQASRQQTVRSGADYPALMRTLGLNAAIGLAGEPDLDRVAELVQRTNQFNTTTIRYQKHELAALRASSDGRLLVGELADKFGALGLVGAVVIRLSEAEAVLENVVMSCRAMGFGMERVLLACAVSQCAGRRIVGRFEPSGRNQPAESLFANAGFREEQAGVWVLPDGVDIRCPEWIAVVDR